MSGLDAAVLSVGSGFGAGSEASARNFDVFLFGARLLFDVRLCL
ncbi:MULTISPECIES: hypothetical protein [unclassified Helicobacter]|nr:MULTISPECIES: hypothetical protein [unclassified Helicobacter]